MRLTHALAAPSRLLGASLFAVIVGAQAAAAQSPMAADAAFSTRPIRLGFAGGVVVPRTGATIQKLKTGVQGQGFLLIQIPGLPALRANVDYAKLQFDKPSLDQGGATTDADRTVLDGVLALKLDLIRTGPIRPYVLAGVGAFNVKDVIAGAQAGSEQSFQNTNFGIDGGAGLAFKLGPIAGFLETRIQNVYTKEGGLVDQKSIQSFPVSFGIMF